MAKHKNGVFKVSDLVLIRDQPCCKGLPATPENPLQIGELVHLNSGGADMTVVDIDAGRVVTAWRGGRKVVYEVTYHPACLHRAIAPNKHP